MELSDEAKEQIAEAVRIVTEDKLYARILASKNPEAPVKPEPVAPVEEPTTSVTPPVTDPTGPQSPPAKEPPVEPPAIKKRGLYWGEES
jgi:hypothetical protein